MADKERAILVKLLGDATGLSRAGKQGESALNSIDGAAKKAGQALRAGALVGAAAVAGIGTAAVMASADFDRSMREVNTLLGLPAEGFERLKGQALDLAEDIGRVPSEVVPALYQAISAGVPQDNVFAFLETANQAAVGGVTSLETSVDALTTATNAWSAQGLTASDAADVLFTAVKGGKTNFDELAGTIGRVAPLAAAAGISFDETAAATAALTTQGFATAEAITGIRAGITALLRPSEDMTAIFQAAGFASAESAIQQEGMAGAMQLVFDATGGNIGKMTELLGSTEAVNAVLGLTGPNAEKMAAQMDLMGERTGAAGAAFEEMEMSAGRAWERIQAKVQVGLVRLGERVLPTLVKALDGFGNWWDQHQPQITAAIDAIQNAAVGFANNFKRGLDVVWPPISRLFSFIVENKPVLVGVLTAIGAAVTLAFGPLGVATVAIVGAIALIGRFRDSWQDVAISIVGALEGATNAVLDGLAKMADKVGDFLEFTLNPVLSAAQWLGIGNGPIQIAEGGGALGGRSVDFSGFMDAIDRTRSNRASDEVDTADLFTDPADAIELTTDAALKLGDTLTGGPGVAGGGTIGALEKAAEAVEVSNDAILEAFWTGGKDAVATVIEQTQAQDAEWERQRRLAEEAGLKVTDEHRKIWDQVEQAAEEARRAIEAEIKKLADSARGIGAGIVSSANQIMLDLVNQGVTPEEAARLRDELVGADKQMATDRIMDAFMRGEIDAGTANRLANEIRTGMPSGGVLGDVDRLIEDAKAASAKMVQQNITVNVEDRSPAAIANAVTLAAQEGASRAIMETAQ